jgi:hypothetical protein
MRHTTVAIEVEETGGDCPGTKSYPFGVYFWVAVRTPRSIHAHYDYTSYLSLLWAAHCNADGMVALACILENYKPCQSYS